MARSADGFLTAQLLYVTAKLGVAGAGRGPRTGPEIAAAVGADPDALTRALRWLVLEEVLAEAGEGRFALTELGEWLRADLPGSMRGGVLARGELYYRAAAGVADRCELVAGDFFGDLPAGADAYLLSRVLHDWADDARRILGACRSAMPPGGRLLIVEALLPERAAEQPAVIRMDLYMLVLLGARERTEAQFRRLLSDSGFDVRRVAPPPARPASASSRPPRPLPPLALPLPGSRHGVVSVLRFITEVRNQGTCEAPCSTTGPPSTARSPPS